MPALFLRVRKTPGGAAVEERTCKQREGQIAHKTMPLLIDAPTLSYHLNGSRKMDIANTPRQQLKCSQRLRSLSARCLTSANEAGQPLFRVFILGGLLVTALAVAQPTSGHAACELYPLFTPLSGRTSNEAWEADKFAASIGVNLHVGDGRYDTEFDTLVKPKVLAGGFRVVRSNVRAVNYNTEQLQALGRAGLKITLATDSQTRMDKLVAGLKAVGPSYILSVEGLNEPESRHDCGDADSCWVQPTRDHQMLLYNTVKSDPATRPIRVLGPSLKTQNLDFSPRMLGNIDQFMEGFSIHRYLNPEQYPENRYTMSKLTALFQYGSPSKPAFLTETGYTSAKTSEASEAVYMPRIYLYNFDHGMALTDKYDLLDLSPDKSNVPLNRGYIRYNRSVKPAFTAVSNLASLVQDRGSRFRPGVLDYTLSGNTANVYKVLLQKRDGTYYLAFWVALPIADTVPQAIAVNLPSSVYAAAVVKPNDGRTWQDIPITDGRIDLMVDEKVTMLRLLNTDGPPSSC